MSRRKQANPKPLYKGGNADENGNEYGEPPKDEKAKSPSPNHTNGHASTADEDIFKEPIFHSHSFTTPSSTTTLNHFLASFSPPPSTGNSVDFPPPLPSLVIDEDKAKPLKRKHFHTQLGDDCLSRPKEHADDSSQQNIGKGRKQKTPQRSPLNGNASPINGKGGGGRGADGRGNVSQFHFNFNTTNPTNGHLETPLLPLVPHLSHLSPVRDQRTSPTLRDELTSSSPGREKFVSQFGKERRASFSSPAYSSKLGVVETANEKPLSPTVGKQRRSASKIQPISVDPVDGQTKIYECPLCFHHLATDHALTIHIRNHNHEREPQTRTDNPQDAPSTSNRSTSPVSTEEGANGANTLSHSCTICGKFLSSQSSLDRHMLVHSGERPFVCPLCNMAFTTNGNMHRHLRIHEREGTTTAEEIQEKYSGKGNRGRKRKAAAAAQGEEEKKSVGVTSATVGGKSSQPKSEKTSGKKKKQEQEKQRQIGNPSDEPTPHTSSRFSPSTQLTCPLCAKSFLSEIGFKFHMEEHSRAATAGSACPECDATFTSPHEFAVHVQSVHRLGGGGDSRIVSKPLGFGDLNLDFSSHKFREAMLQRCTEGVGRSAPSPFHTFNCRICDKAFPSVAVLKMHYDQDHKDFFKNARDQTYRDHGATSTSAPPPPLLGPLNLVSRSAPQPTPLAMQDHILDLSKKRNTTYYEQINLIKEHTSPRDTLEKVAAMLNSKYSTESSVQRDLHHGGGGGGGRGDILASSSADLTRRILAATALGKVEDLSTSSHSASTSTEDRPQPKDIKEEGEDHRPVPQQMQKEMQISPNVVGMNPANREGVTEEEEDEVGSVERSSSTSSSAENDLVNVVDDVADDEIEQQQKQEIGIQDQHLPLLKTTTS